MAYFAASSIDTPLPCINTKYSHQEIIIIVRIIIIIIIKGNNNTIIAHNVNVLHENQKRNLGANFL